MVGHRGQAGVERASAGAGGGRRVQVGAGGGRRGQVGAGGSRRGWSEQSKGQVGLNKARLKGSDRELEKGRLRGQIGSWKEGF